MGVSPFEQARRNMLDGQLKPGNIADEYIMDVLGSVPRQPFVPQPLQGSAYVDADLQVAPNRYLLSPVLQAKLLEIAAVKQDDHVLDIGCATGYSSVLLGHLANKVIAVEAQMELAEQARRHISRFRMVNAEVVTGPLAQGYASAAPYDVILINGAIQVLPEELVQQLAEGGRLVTVLNVDRKPGQTAGLGRAIFCQKVGGRLFQKEIFDAFAPLLPGFEKKSRFVL